MRIDRVWYLPNKWTFTIPPIAKLLKEEMNGGTWIDPYCGKHSPATIKNDLNLEINADHHEEALTFLNRFEPNSVDGVLYDPPYSMFQITRHYRESGIKNKNLKHLESKKKIQVSKILKPNAKVIKFGWNSCGIGKSNGKQRRTTHLKLERILLVCHGGERNDTIVTVERKINESLD